MLIPLNMKNCCLFIFLFFVWNIGEAQHLLNNKTSVIEKTDTVDIHLNYFLIVHLPSKAIKTNSTYEGGYFVSYYIPADTVVFSVYSGGLPQTPFVTGIDCRVTDSIMVKPVFFERRGYCKQSNEKLVEKVGFFREKAYELLSYSAKYEWVHESKVERYDTIFSRIEYIEKQP